jgi:hypothetical protein
MHDQREAEWQSWCWMFPLMELLLLFAAASVC